MTKIPLGTIGQANQLVSPDLQPIWLGPTGLTLSRTHGRTLTLIPFRSRDSESPPSLSASSGHLRGSRQRRWSQSTRLVTLLHPIRVDLTSAASSARDQPYR
jgi:hypothetical protein